MLRELSLAHHSQRNQTGNLSKGSGQRPHGLGLRGASNRENALSVDLMPSFLPSSMALKQIDVDERPEPNTRRPILETTL